ncbi:MAG: lytic murein transglycosylase [Rickettsiales bacterium]|jgi:membrane-bound lytic murein transglycosylase B|nr:lytic murein transglycosylase [Rickettsiales bacterium]
MIKPLAIFAAACLAAFAGAKANEVPEELIYDSSQFASWLSDFKAFARKRHKISQATLSAAFSGVKFQQKVIDADRRQPEFVKPFWSYYDSALKPERVANGKVKLEEHAKLLEAAHRKYNVQPHVIVAFWGMETNYGAYMGDLPVISSLATLAYDLRRREFFTAELVEALKIIERGHMKPSEMKGSWAGAFGNFQFLPSVFNRHAVDGDGDGKIDIVKSVPDAVFSAANYLSKMGWNGRYRWGRPVSFPEGDLRVWAEVNSNEWKPLSLFRSLGVKSHNGRELPAADIQASLVAPSGAEGPVFVTYENFRRIMRWNASTSYALAVGLLSDAIVAKSMDVFERPSGWDKAAATTTAQIMEIQAALSRLGLYDAKVTGLYGRTTAKAIKDYQSMLLAGDKKVSGGGAVAKYKSGKAIIPDGYPSLDLYDTLVAK